MALAPDAPFSASALATNLLIQISVAMIVAYLVGKLSAWLLNHIKLEELGLIPIFILASFVLATYGSEMLGGNILLASYIVGVVIGNGIERGKVVSIHFFNSVSWLAQALMFIILGLQIFPSELVKVFWQSLAPAMLLILVARPLAVQICYLLFPSASWQKRLFVSAIGLKGATPIVFALIPAAAGFPEAIEMAHMVFFIVLFSVVIQGGAIDILAKKLKLKAIATTREAAQSVWSGSGYKHSKLHLDRFGFHLAHELLYLQTLVRPPAI